MSLNRNQICQRVARELNDGDYVNLGIGVPTLVANFVPEGVEGRVPYKGVVVKVLDQFEGGLRQSMGNVGCKTIESMQTETEFVEVTNAGMMESHVHDVMITKEAPNYQRS